MTSGDTNEKTIQLLKFNDYFGMKQSQITIVQQGEGVPALEDNDAKMCLAPGEPSLLLTKPHGHGDIHALLHTNGVARQWKENGIKWLCLFQDTNGLAFHTLPLMLGVSVKKNLIMNSLAVVSPDLWCVWCRRTDFLTQSSILSISRAKPNRLSVELPNSRIK